VGFGVVVLFAEEDDVGAGEAGEHSLRGHVGSRGGRDDAIAHGRDLNYFRRRRR